MYITKKRLSKAKRLTNQSPFRSFKYQTYNLNRQYKFVQQRRYNQLKTILTLHLLEHCDVTHFSDETNYSRVLKVQYALSVAEEKSTKFIESFNYDIDKIIQTILMLLYFVTGFKDFIHLLNPKNKVPSCKTLTMTILPKLYEKCKSAPIDSLKKVNSVSISANGWTSLAKDNYLGITCHFYSETENSSIELISSPLDIVLIRKNEKAETLAAIIKKVLVEFNILRKVSHSHIITDNGANMKATAELLQIKHLPCFAHTLNLVLPVL